MIRHIVMFKLKDFGSDTEDLETYRVHPDHQAFIEFNKGFSVSKAVTDYFFD